MKKFSVWIFIASVILVPTGIFGMVKWMEAKYTALPVLLGEDHRIENFQLTDQHGKTVSLKNWEDKIVIADFFFTHCPVVCPKMTRSMKEVQALYKGDNDLLFQSFSVDPLSDTVGQLKLYAEKMGIAGNWQLLTGDKKEIYRLARNSFRVVVTDGDGGPQDFIHSELLVLIDKEKRIRGYYNGTDAADVKALLRDVGRLKRSYRN